MQQKVFFLFVHDDDDNAADTGDDNIWLKLWLGLKRSLDCTAEKVTDSNVVMSQLPQNWTGHFSRIEKKSIFAKYKINSYLTQKLPMSGESMEEVNTELDKLDNVLEVFTNIIIIAIFFIVTVLKISTIFLYDHSHITL